MYILCITTIYNINKNEPIIDLYSFNTQYYRHYLKILHRYSCGLLLCLLLWLDNSIEAEHKKGPYIFNLKKLYKCQDCPLVNYFAKIRGCAIVQCASMIYILR